MTTILIIVYMGTLSITKEPSRSELNRSTEEIVYAMKKVQLWAMLGHRDETMSQGEFILRKQSYSIFEGFGKTYMERKFPEYIESEHINKRVYFSSYGLPYDGTEFILQDKRTGAKNRIWISVQTGRIRWEAL